MRLKTWPDELGSPKPLFFELLRPNPELYAWLYFSARHQIIWSNLNTSSAEVQSAENKEMESKLRTQQKQCIWQLKQGAFGSINGDNLQAYLKFFHGNLVCIWKPAKGKKLAFFSCFESI